ncbi:hypothetical protein [Aeromonas sp. MR16]|uniref:hypothetical protein n=1 Tax=Aeromonas sp. MR16 TaxID=2923420 RepID=UPI001F4A87B7|nr:hypothetical protein [Aeromonas sp. MR16]MCH7369876.1 hypothetical protein [Aeromonas sp. MR16]
MNMSEHRRLCEEMAKQWVNNGVNLSHEALLEQAAQDRGFKSFVSLEGLHKLLGSEGVPTKEAIINAGGDPQEAPMMPLHSTISSGWSEAGSVT